MTLEEIKKAFNICHNTPSCTGCPMLKLEKQNGHGCKHNLFISAIGLITEQEKEIEELKKNQVIKEFAKKLKEAVVFDYFGVRTIEEANELSLIASPLTYDVVIDKIDELLKKYEV